MKKLAATLAALLLASACGGEQQQAPGSQAPPAATPTETMIEPVAPTTETPPSTPTAAPPAKPALAQLQRDAVRELAAAFNAHDPKRIAALYAPDARIGGPGPSGWMEETGKAAVENSHRQLFTAFPDMKWASPRVFIRGPVVIQEWVATATHAGDLGTMRATDKPIGLHGASVYWFNDDGLIVKDDTYYDASAIAFQVGAQKGKSRAIPELPAGDPQLLQATGVPDDDRFVDTAKALYSSYSKAGETAFLGALSKDVVHIPYGAAEDRRGEKAVRQDFQSLIRAFPDVKVDVRNAWGFGDRVVVETLMTGTQTGPLGTVKATKRPVTLHSLDLLRFDKDGKIVEISGYSSTIELMGQLHPATGTQPAIGQGRTP